MKSSPEETQAVRFGPFEYDPLTGDLRRRGHRVRLVGQPRELLGLLLERPGAVITREEMRARLWPDDTFVDFEHSLNSAIKKLRQALRDSAMHPQYIETIPRQGYRFIASVISSAETRAAGIAPLGASPEPAAPQASSEGAPAWQPESASAPPDGKEHEQSIPLAASPLRRFLRPALMAILSVIAALLIALLSLHHRGEPQVPSGTKLTLLVSGEGLLSDPAISPDGTMLAYVKADKGMGHIYVRRVAGGDPLRLLDEPDREAEPAFSPDGERIAFTRYPERSSRSQICIGPALGGSPACVLSDAYAPAWSPAGRRLAFIREQPGSTDELAVSSSDGSGVRTLLAPDSTFPFLRSPSWSADGRLIAFERSMGGANGELWLIPAAGGAAKRLETPRPGVNLHHPVFSPDGKSIFYVSNQNGADDLWRRDLRGTSRPLQVTQSPAMEAWPSVSRTGRAVFVENQAKNTLLVTRLQTGATTAVLSHSPYLWAPSFSPDGQEIALSEAEYNGHWRIWAVPLAGAHPRPLTDGNAPQIYSRFSRDGRWITYFTWASGESRIWRVPRRGGRTEPLTPAGEDDAYGELSPDGRMLAFARTEHGATRIELMPLGGVERQLTPAPSTVPCWSPDGKWIAFSPNRGYQGGIFVIHPNGSGMRRLTQSGGWPVWFPGGARIAYRVIGPDGSEQIQTVFLSNGKKAPLGRVNYSGRNDPFAFSPDGRLIAYTQSEVFSSEIWLLDARR